MKAVEFRCRCGAHYKVARQEAPPERDGEVTCLSCGAPLDAREGNFVLKYFRVKRPHEEVRLAPRQETAAPP
jgi:hypothetical protein